MGDLKNHQVIVVKGVLFLVLGCLATAVFLLRSPAITDTILHCIAIWAFCRFYYFTFYVIEKYVDSNYRFSGLWAFLRYILRSRHVRTAVDDVA